MDKTDYSDIFNEVITGYPNSAIIAGIVSKAVSTCCDRTWKRINDILKYAKYNNTSQLKLECYAGLPDDLPSLRALIWKLNLRYLPRDISKWDEQLKKKRKEYQDLKNAFNLRAKMEVEILDEFEQSKKGEIDNEEEKKKISTLAASTDKALLETIDKDINRTHLNFDFFSKPVQVSDNLKSEEIDEMYLKKRNVTYNNYKDVYFKKFFASTELETHSDVIGRILYIYSKLNKDISYVQGMNEILAPIYFCYASDNSVMNTTDNIEADSFWSFFNLMSDLKNAFKTEKDRESGGMFFLIEVFQKLIKKIEPRIYKQFKANKIDCIHFSFRWFCLFFAQDFEIPDILRLWDTVFCESDRYYFIYVFSLAVLKYFEKDILQRDFFGVIKLLQKLECDEIDTLLDIALNIHSHKGEKIKKIILEENKEKRRKKIK